MKKILFLLSVISVIVFAACDYNDRNFDGLDDMTTPVYKPALTYEFVDADYKSLQTAVKNGGGSVDLQNLAKTVGTNRYFTVTESAKDLIPYFLAGKYYSVSKGASAKVSYKFFEALPEELVSLKEYKMDADDYLAIWEQPNVEFLTDAKSPAVEIPGILKTAFPDVTEAGQIVAVNYNYSAEEPDLNVPVEVDILKEDFQGYAKNEPINKNGWSIVSVSGKKAWEARTYSNNMYAFFNAGASAPEAEEDWMITPEIDLSGSFRNSFTFDYQLRYVTNSMQPLTVKVSKTYTGGAVNPADWTDVTDQFSINLPEGESMDNFASAGTMNLSAYSGKIRIAFVYKGGPVNNATNVQIDNVVVKGYVDAAARNAYAAPGAAVSLYKLFSFNGTKWAEYTKAVILNPADYTAMGDPGKNGNFSSSILPEKYLPVYLLQQYPYAQEKDLKTVIYKYYDGKNTVLRASEYRYTEGAWAANNIVDEQYVFNGTKWMFDPSITHTIVKGNGDMQIIVDWVAANKGEKYYQENPKGGYFTNAEYWFGASEYQGNFEMRVDNRRAEDAKRDNLFKGKTDDEVEAALYAQLKDAFHPLLEKRYPNAQPQQSGADVYYNVIFQVYATGGVRKNYTIKYQCTEVGKFTFVEGPKEKE